MYSQNPFFMAWIYIYKFTKCMGFPESDYKNKFKAPSYLINDQLQNC